MSRAQRHSGVDVRAVLDQSPAFSGLSPKAMGLIGSAVTEQVVRSGQVVFELGQRARTLYVVASGRLAL